MPDIKRLEKGAQFCEPERQRTQSTTVANRSPDHFKMGKGVTA
ncbi:MAG: hypothetical protein ACYCVD_19360 [Desulfitobacteriaceae bacterium]